MSALTKLSSIKDLKLIDFGNSVPTHSLVLLHWFANTIEIGLYEIILTFKPNIDYGAHYYGNHTTPPVLPELPQGKVKYQYYTLGKSQTSNQNSTRVLPLYVTQHPSNKQAHNRDRILFRVKQGIIIDEVYITQHLKQWKQGSDYDRNHTYQISINLLREIRRFSKTNLGELRYTLGSEINNYQLSNFKMKEGDHTGCELLLHIVCKACHMKLEVETGDKGNTKIHWSNIPQHLVDMGVMVELFKNNVEVNYSRTIVDMPAGSYDTPVPLTPGLQVRLHKTKSWLLFWTTMGEEICRGEEFHNHESEMTIRGYDARLQLFVKDGKACAHLYVSKAFTNWRSEFKNSWVGFYSSESQTNKEYETWQWATKFTRCTQTGVFDIYEYHSSMAIAPRVQARFIFSEFEAIACTPTWK